MAQSIKNRVFGSDVPPQLKDKIKLRQILSKTSPSAHESIQGIMESTEYESNFKGVADLSSRTPFIRMWTSLDLAKDLNAGELSEDDAKKWEAEKYKTDETGNYVNIDEEGYKDYYLVKKKDQNTYEMHKWDGKLKKTYEIGNHVLNTLERDINAPLKTEAVGEGEEIIDASIVKKVLPYEQETDLNQWLKPPAGITGLSSETEGSLGTLKRTTVNFIVHNLSDFENIYLRYFLKPGAQVFVDFGWDTAYLYDVETLVEDVDTDIEDKLYGEFGYVTKSNGDLETLYGHVVNYDAKVRDDGGFDCSVEIISKNAALLSNSFDSSLKERVKYGLDIEAMGLAVSGVLGDPFIWFKTRMWDNNAKTENQLRKTLQIAAAKILGGTSAPLPGIKGSTPSLLALEYGVFYAGALEENMRLFVSFGWFEDKFLNKEFGFSDNLKSLINQDRDSSTDDEKTLKSKFNSRNSFATYNKGLMEAMRNRGFYEGAVFLYPETWGSVGKTYNIGNLMTPDRYKGGKLRDMGEYTSGKWYKEEEEKDIKEGRIPLRELFISVDMIKESMDLASTSGEFFKNIMNRIREASGGIIDMGLRSNNYGQNTLSFIDKNKIISVDTQPTTATEEPEFLKELLLFKPYSPDTICKGYELSFTMPQGGLGDMLAIQSSDVLNTEQSLNAMLDGFIKLEELNRNYSISDEELRKYFVRYTPSIGDEAGRRFKRVTEQSGFSKFNLSNNALLNLTGGDKVTKYEHSLGNDMKFGDVLVSGDSAKKFIETVNSNLNSAINLDPNSDGTLIEPATPVEDTPEDTKKAEEDLARSGGLKLVNTPYEWYLKGALKGHSSKTTPLIPIEASLTIYGISGFLPGDLIRINYLPKNYFKNVYFQVTKVEQNVGESWSTTLTTQMRIVPLNSMADEESKFIVRKSYLRNVLKLEDVDSFIHLFDNLLPVNIGKMDSTDGEGNKISVIPTYIDHIFLCHSAADADDFTLPVILSDEDEKAFQNALVGFINKDIKGKGDSTLNIKPTYDGKIDLWGLIGATCGCEVEVSGFKTGVSFYIYTSGRKWIIVSKTGFEDKINTLFKLSRSKIMTRKLKRTEVSGGATAPGPFTPETTEDGTLIQNSQGHYDYSGGGTGVNKN